MDDFKKGTKIKLTNGDFVTVKSKIGEGGQGCVYKVDYNGKDYAMKWYLHRYLRSLKSVDKFYNNLASNIASGSPSQKFLWMKAVATTGKHSKGFGYVMDLRPDNYAEFTKFVKAKEFFANTSAVINAAINIVEAFMCLHRKGYSYQDLSPGNFFIDKNTGDVLICDNDNVAPNNKNLGVSGTPGYIAPEVLLGQARPSASTDLFSLSVILFELFFLSHPLNGAKCCKYPCLTPKVEKELYAQNPVFVCSKTDTSNAPVRGTCSNLINLWPTYPTYLHDAFQDAFSNTALKNGINRLTERDWTKVLYKLQDDVVVCKNCGEANFASMIKDGKTRCMSCKKTIVSPVSIVGDRFEIVAGKGKILSEYHLSFGDKTKSVALFVESKKTAGVFGLKNESDYVWEVTYPDNTVRNYNKGEVVTLVPDTTIVFGNNKIVVKN